MANKSRRFRRESEKALNKISSAREHYGKTLAEFDKIMSELKELEKRGEDTSSALSRFHECRVAVDSASKTVTNSFRKHLDILRAYASENKMPLGEYIQGVEEALNWWEGHLKSLNERIKEEMY